MTGPGRTKRGRGNEAGEKGFATPESSGEGLLTLGLPVYLGLESLPRKEGATNCTRETYP